MEKEERPINANVVLDAHDNRSSAVSSSDEMFKLSPQLEQMQYRAKRLGTADLDQVLSLAESAYCGQEHVERMLRIPFDASVRYNLQRARHSVENGDCAVGVYQGEQLAAMMLNSLYDLATEDETYDRNYRLGDPLFDDLLRYYDDTPPFRISERLRMRRWMDLGFAATAHAHRRRGLCAELMRVSECVAHERGCDYVITHATSVASASAAMHSIGMQVLAEFRYEDYRDRQTGANPFHDICEQNPAQFVLYKKLTTVVREL